LRLDPAQEEKKTEIPQKKPVSGKNFVQIALDLHNFKCWLIGLCLFPQRIRRKMAGENGPDQARKLVESE